MYVCTVLCNKGTNWYNKGVSKLKNDPLISVVMVNYNYDKYIAEAIESVLSQSYKNIEFIVIDDGSTDNSRSVISKYAKKDKRIKFLKQNNKGVVASRNRGLKEKHGEFFVFIDADDVIPATFVENMLKTIIENKADVSCCDLQQFGKLDGLLKVDTQSVEGLIKFQATPICQMVRSKVSEDIFFDENLSKFGHEDADFFFNLFLHGAKFIKSSEIYMYRMHGKGRNPDFTSRTHYKARFYIYNKYKDVDDKIKYAPIDLILQKEQETDKWHKIADERLDLIERSNEYIKGLEEKCNTVVDSLEYKAGRYVTFPVRAIKRITKRI